MTELYSDHSTPYAAGRNDGPNLNNHTYPINNDIPYPAQNNGGNHILPPSSTSSNTPSSPESNSPVHTTPKTESATSPASAAARQEGKQQATFLTKLYALLEREENHHMIRWDPQGEHIIVEKPEQLAIHVLPSVYRQSRFASFSRQLNIYGFMRKVNLRNVDPAIDDPDASTWSHPTLNRHSPADVVANFKRRVPPRIPKSKKRAEEQAQAQAQAQRQQVGLAPMAPMAGGRARAFTAPGSFTPLSQGGAVGWSTSYPRSQIPPLDVPGQPHHLPQGPMFGSHHTPYGQSSHGHQLSPADEQPHFNSMPPYQNQGRELMLPSQQYPYQEQAASNWSFGMGPGPNSTSHSSGSLSSLLNPSGGGGYARPSLNTYGSSFPPIQGQAHSPSSPSDSRPNTGYSVSSVTSVGGGYDEPKSGHPFAHEYSRPTSSHHPRQLSPGPASRPGSSHNPNFAGGSLSVRRTRRHSQAQSPYPSPYDQGPDGRPSTSPPSATDRVGAYGFSSGHGDFAYSAGGFPPGAPGVDSADPYSRSVRPSTSASSMSTASHASSQAATPPVGGDFAHGGETDISRFSPDFGFVAMDQHIPAYAKTAVVEL